jgi:hypothetical protein
MSAADINRINQSGTIRSWRFRKQAAPFLDQIHNMGVFLLSLALKLLIYNYYHSYAVIAKNNYTFRWQKSIHCNSTSLRNRVNSFRREASSGLR